MVLKSLSKVYEKRLTGLQKNKIQAARELNMAAVAKIAKPLKSTFPPKLRDIFG